MSVCLYVCVLCVFIKLHITAQSGPVIYSFYANPCNPPGCVCAYVSVFFTLTDGASIIPSNIRGCQSRTWSDRNKAKTITKNKKLIPKRIPYQIGRRDAQGTHKIKRTHGTYTNK